MSVCLSVLGMVLDLSFVVTNRDTPLLTTLSRVCYCHLDSSQPLLEVPSPHGFKEEAGDQATKTCLLKVHSGHEIHWKPGFVFLALTFAGCFSK